MITYKDAGVDVERGYEAVRRMKQHVAATFDENVLGGLGSFGGFYSIENENVEKPVLVAGTDGVGGIFPRMRASGDGHRQLHEARTGEGSHPQRL